MVAAGDKLQTDRLLFDMFGTPYVGMDRTRGLRGWVERLQSPWDIAIVLAAAVGLWSGATLGAWIIVDQDASTLSLVLGIPLVVISAAVAAHLVPPRIVMRLG